MTAITLTAGAFGSYRGYAKSGSPTGLGPIGSISGQPLPGFVLDSLTTGPSNELWFEGDTTGQSFTLMVDGVAWGLSSGSFGGGYTSYSVTPVGGGFTNGVAYTVNTAGYEGPTWTGLSTALGSTASGTINFTSSGRAAGDQLYIAVATANQTMPAPTDFSEIPTVSPQSQGTAGAAGAIRLTVFQKVSDGTETTVTIADSGDHQYAIGFVVRPSSGQAVTIDVSGGKNVAATTSQSGNALTTTVDNCLFLDIWATDRDSAGPSYSGQANAGLTNLTERWDAGTTQGTGSGIVIYSGERTAAGSVAATTATCAASTAYCAITLAVYNGAASVVVAPATGHEFYTGYVPTVARTANQTIAPSTGHLLYTGRVPTIIQNTIVAPSSGHLVYTGYVPTVAQSVNTNVAPGTGHLLYTGYIPTIVQPHTVAPSTGHLVYTGYVPTVSQTNNQSVAPATGHLLYTGYTPTVTQTANNTVAGATGHLTYTGYIPVVTQSANQSVAPSTGHLLHTGYVPSVSQSGANVVSPLTGHLIYQGYAPSVTQSGGGGGDQFRVGGETVQALFQTDRIAFPWDVRMKTNT